MRKCLMVNDGSFLASTYHDAALDPETYLFLQLRRGIY